MTMSENNRLETAITSLIEVQAKFAQTQAVMIQTHAGFLRDIGDLRRDIAEIREEVEADKSRRSRPASTVGFRGQSPATDKTPPNAE
jgi:selenocysteine-specific translation elongation factor